MSKNGLLVLLVLIPLGCRTSMGTRKDASPGTEAGAADILPDALVSLDTVARGDLPAPDAAPGHESPDSAIDAPADSSIPDTARDLGSESAQASLTDLAGRTFRLSASEALPDAGLYGRSCATSKPGANYAITFSSDGAKVTIRRTDPIQEVDMTGTLQPGSSSGITYRIETAMGGQLQIRRENGDLIGELVLYGSGVPVIWCIQSPMRPV